MRCFLLATIVVLLISSPASANSMVYGSLLSEQVSLTRKVGFSALSRINDFLLRHKVMLAVTDIRDGIYSSEVDDYLNNKDSYDMSYYEGLVVLFHRQGSDKVGAGIAYRANEVSTDKAVVDHLFIGVEQIKAVLVWNHRDYGKRAVIHRKRYAQLIFAENLQKDAQDVDDDARLYGNVAGVFSDGSLAIRVSVATNAKDGQHGEFSPARIYVVERWKVKIK